MKDIQPILDLIKDIRKKEKELLIDKIVVRYDSVLGDKDDLIADVELPPHVFAYYFAGDKDILVYEVGFRTTSLSVKKEGVSFYTFIEHPNHIVEDYVNPAKEDNKPVENKDGTTGKYFVP